MQAWYGEENYYSSCQNSRVALEHYYPKSHATTRIKTSFSNFLRYDMDFRKLAHGTVAKHDRLFPYRCSSSLPAARASPILQLRRKSTSCSIFRELRFQAFERTAVASDWSGMLKPVRTSKKPTNENYPQEVPFREKDIESATCGCVAKAREQEEEEGDFHRVELPQLSATRAY